MGVPVKGKAEISIKSLTTDPIRINPGDRFTMILRIENTGTDDAKSVSASVDLPMDGNREAFIGKIEPDNDAPAVFYLRDRDDGEIPYTLRVRSTDEYRTHTVEKPLTISVTPQDNSGLIFIVIVLWRTSAPAGCGTGEQRGSNMASSFQVSAIPCAEKSYTG